MNSPVDPTAALLRERGRELVGYLRFLREATQSNACLVASGSRRQHVMTKGLTHTLKANVYLLLYSTMEASMVQLLDDMHEAIGANCTGTDELNEQLVLMVARNFRERKTDIDPEAMRTPIQRTMFATLVGDWRSHTKSEDKRAAGIAGNIDSRAIWLRLGRYGVVSDRLEDVPSHLKHTALQRAKAQRNKLAHGEVSFADLGRDLTYEELLSDARHVMKTLVRITQTVAAWLAARHYLAAPTALQSSEASSARATA